MLKEQITMTTTTKKRLYIQQTKPFVELEVKPEGSSQEAVTFGFKLFGLKDREELSKELTEFIENNSEGVQALSATQQESFAALSDVEKENIIAKALAFMGEQEEFNLVKARDAILYIKGTSISDYDKDNNPIFTKVIEDTRTVTPLPEYWETPEEALQIILDSFFDNKGWKEAILAKHQESLSTDYSVERSKN